MSDLVDVDGVVGALRATSSVDGLLVFGSHARADARPTSDLDLLVVLRNGTSTSRRRALQRRIALGDARVSAIFFSEDTLMAELNRHPSFAAHLADEGVLAGGLTPSGPWWPRLDGYVPSAAELDGELSGEVAALDLFRDVSRFNGQFVTSLGRLYSVARAVVIIKLLRRGVHEYRWHSIFSEYSAFHPALGRDIGLVASLRPHYEYLIDRRSDPPVRVGAEASSETVLASVAAISAIAAAEGDDGGR